jgi:hypothetical protein
MLARTLALMLVQTLALMLVQILMQTLTLMQHCQLMMKKKWTLVQI